MTQERKRKQFQYKRANFHEGSASLSSLVAEALKRKSTIGARRESIAPDGEKVIWRLIGDFHVDDVFTFGVLMRYVPGLHPACLIDDESAETVKLEQLTVPITADGKAREVVADMLYFACCDNHMVLMQGGSLRAIHLEHHLSWLLRDAGVMTATNIISLNDTPTRAVAEKLAQFPVREIDLSGDLIDPEEQGTPGAVADRQARERLITHTVRDEASSGMMRVIKKLIETDPNARIDTDALADSNICYTLTIRYMRSTTEDGQKLMNDLGNALRNVEGIDPTIHLVGGGEITGSDLKISGNVSITHYDGVPSSPEVFEEMRSWLLEKVKSSELAA